MENPHLKKSSAVPALKESVPELRLVGENPLRARGHPGKFVLFPGLTLEDGRLSLKKYLSGIRIRKRMVAPSLNNTHPVGII